VTLYFFEINSLVKLSWKIVCKRRVVNHNNKIMLSTKKTSEIIWVSAMLFYHYEVFWNIFILKDYFYVNVPTLSTLSARYQLDTITQSINTFYSTMPIFQQITNQYNQCIATSQSNIMKRWTWNSIIWLCYSSSCYQCCVMVKMHHLLHFSYIYTAK